MSSLMVTNTRRVAVIAVAAFLTACSAPSLESTSPQPGAVDLTPAELSDGWAVGAPADAGFDTEALMELTASVGAGGYPNTHAVLIESDGRLVYEQYFTGTDERWGESLGEVDFGRESLHDLRSISKSVTAALLGIALGQDFEDAVNTPAASYLGLDGTASGVTLHHVLTMTAGLAWNEMDVAYTDVLNDEIHLYEVDNPAQYVLTRPAVADPGTSWYYSGGLTQVLATIVHERTGQRLDEYARDSLFASLGITDFEWLGPGSWKPDDPAAMSGLRLRARDLAKLGSTYLHRGRWNGTQVVPDAWVSRSMTRHVAEIAEWSEGGRWGYGYQWWSGETVSGRRVVAGVGNGNQRLFILPEDDLVVTVLAGEYNRFDGHSDRILGRILAAR